VAWLDVQVRVAAGCASSRGRWQDAEITRDGSGTHQGPSGLRQIATVGKPCRDTICRKLRLPATLSRNFAALPR
jgi:hypothetical protein